MQRVGFASRSRFRLESSRLRDFMGSDADEGDRPRPMRPKAPRMRREVDLRLRRIPTLAPSPRERPSETTIASGAGAPRVMAPADPRSDRGTGGQARGLARSPTAALSPRSVSRRTNFSCVASRRIDTGEGLRIRMRAMDRSPVRCSSRSRSRPEKRMSALRFRAASPAGRLTGMKEAAC
jgi:hypothetical protein